MRSSWSPANPPPLRMQMQALGAAATAECLSLSRRILSGPGEAGGAPSFLFVASLSTKCTRTNSSNLLQSGTGGLRGPGLSTLLGGLARFLCAFLLFWPPAPSSRSHHTQRRSSDCAVAAALVSGQYLETSLSCIIHVEQSGFNI